MVHESKSIIMRDIQFMHRLDPLGLLCTETFHIDLHSGKNPQFSEICTCTNYFCIGRDRKKANTHYIYRGGGGGGLISELPPRSSNEIILAL